MKVLLTQDVVGLGDIGQTVEVKPGYGRNYLLPRGAALEFGSVGAKEAAHHLRQVDIKKGRLKSVAEDLAKDISSKKLELTLRVGSGGRVFGSIGARDIAAKLAELGFNIERRRVLLGEPIKKIGDHKVKVKLHPEVITKVEVVITSLMATKEEEAQETEGARIALAKKAAEAQAASGAEEDSDGEEELGEEEAPEIES